MKIGRSGKSEGNADSLFHLTQRSRVQTNRNIARGTCVSSNNWIDSTDGRHAKNVLNVDERLCTPIFLSGSDVQRILQRLTHVEHDHNISAATRASSLHLWCTLDYSLHARKATVHSPTNKHSEFALHRRMRVRRGVRSFVSLSRHDSRLMRASSTI